tara:strand:+ start:330 stop:746 length:417 start_codon:yes stop_codon:yes gene_type:complete
MRASLDKLSNDACITIEEYAGLIGKSPSSVRNDISRNPESLPTPFKLPNSRRLLFRMGTVRKFLQNASEKNDPSQFFPVKKDKKEDLQEFVTWEDFLFLASKVRQQEELIKICFNNGEVLKNDLKEKEFQIKYLYGRK